MMRESQYLAEYAKSHQHETNLWIHMVCVPAIFASSLALLWLVPVGQWLPGVPAAIVPWLNVATVGLPFALVFYARLSAGALLTGAVWVAISVALTLAALQAGWPVFWIAVGIWVAAWLLQFYGHKVEGKKPSFAKDLLFLLIGPLFVQQKFNRLLTSGSIHPQAH